MVLLGVAESVEQWVYSYSYAEAVSVLSLSCIYTHNDISILLDFKYKQQDFACNVHLDITTEP